MMITRGEIVFSHFHHETLPVDVSKVKHSNSRKLYSSDSDLFVSYREYLVAKGLEDSEEETGDGTAAIPLRSNVNFLGLGKNSAELYCFTNTCPILFACYSLRSKFYEIVQIPLHVLGWPTRIIYFALVAMKLFTFGRKMHYFVSEAALTNKFSQDMRRNKSEPRNF